MSNDKPGELSKVGRRVASRVGLSVLIGCLPLLIIGGMFAVLLIVGLIDTDLIAPVFWVGFVSFPPLAIISGVTIGLVLRRRNLGPLESALAAYGPSRSYALTGRQWRAHRSGRDLTLHMSRGGFVITLAATPTTVLRVGRSSALARLATGDRPHRELGSGVFVVGEDAAGLGAVLDAPGVVEALGVALGNDGKSLRSLRTHPTKGLTLTLRYLPEGQKTPQAFEALFDALETVAAAVEG